MTKFELQSVQNTYVNAIILHKYLCIDFAKGKINALDFYNGMVMCQIIMITNFFILLKYGLDQSGQTKIS